MIIVSDVQDGMILSRQMPTKGRPKKSQVVEGAYVYSCELRNGTSSVPIAFHVKGVPLAKIHKVRKWIMKRIEGEHKLEFLLTPAENTATVDVCKLTVSKAEGSQIFRIGFEGPQDINPRGHVHPLSLATRRARLAAHQADAVRA